MTEIQGKSILVRISARFELARVRVIGSQLSHVVLIHHSEGVDKYWNQPFLCRSSSPLGSGYCHIWAI